MELLQCFVERRMDEFEIEGMILLESDSGGREISEFNASSEVS